MSAEPAVTEPDMGESGFSASDGALREPRSGPAEGLPPPDKGRSPSASSSEEEIPTRGNDPTRLENDPTRFENDPTRFEEVGPGDALAPRIDAPLPESLLEPGELVHMLLKPSPLYIVLEPALALAGLGLAVWAIYTLAPWLGLALAPREVLVPLFVLGTGTLMLSAFDWVTRFYMLTNRRVLTVTGLGRPRVRELSLHHVTGVAVTAQMRERLAGLATFWFQSEADADPPVVWRMVARPDQRRDAVARLMRRR